MFASAASIRDLVAGNLPAVTAIIPLAGHEAAAHVAQTHHAPVALEIALMTGSVGVALIGLLFARRLYLTNPTLAAGLGARYRTTYRMLLNKYYVDEIYRVIVVRPLERLSGWFWRFFDNRVIDGLVDGVGSVVMTAGIVLRLFQNGYVGTYAFFFVLGVLLLLAQLVMS